MGSLPKPLPVETQLTNVLERLRGMLEKVNSEVHNHPELAYKEVRAHDTLCNVLSDLGYKVTRHAYGLETAFEAEYGQGGPVIAYNAEYDALPDIGHACGHNLIATSSLAAFLATAEVLAETGIPGRVRLLGTPAEEDGGGKIDIVDGGAYKDVDACLMGHPGPSGGDMDNVILPRLMARASVKVTFKGVNAHAGNTPWLGKNALDAAVAAYTNLSMLRQQTPPNQRLHAIISKGGDRPNIIPHLTEIALYARAETNRELQDTCQRVVDCCEGAAKAAACNIEFEWSKTYMELQCSQAIADRLERIATSQGQKYSHSVPSVSGGSTDQGNVSYAVPSLHPCFGIPVESLEVGPHHPGFRQAAGQPAAFEAALRFAKVLAATGLDVLQDEKLREDMWAEHQERLKCT